MKRWRDAAPGGESKGGVKMKVVSVVYEAEEGGYWAKIPALPGLFAQAETLGELEANLREAVELYLSDETLPTAEAEHEHGRLLEVAV